MVTESRPLVVVGGQIHPDGRALLEREARVSSHVAGVTAEANRQMAMQVAGEMLHVLRGERPDVLVNPDVRPRLGVR